MIKLGSPSSSSCFEARFAETVGLVTTAVTDAVVTETVPHVFISSVL